MIRVFVLPICPGLSKVPQKAKDLGTGFFAMLSELSRNGTQLTRFELPVEGPSISELHVIDDAHLLVVGHHGRHVVVMRLIRTVTPR